MEMFRLTVSQMLVIFTLMLIGYYLRKKKIVEENAYANLSRMEMFLFTPALSFATQMRRCTIENLKDNAVLILYGAAIIIAAGFIAGPLSKLFVKNYKDNRHAEYKKNVYKYAIALANYGFVGNFIILSIFGEEALFKYQMFTFPLSIFTYSWGMYVLIPKDRNSGILKHVLRGVTSFPMLAILGGMLCGVLGLGEKIDSISFVKTVLDNAGACMGPVAMLLAGMVLGNYPLKDMFKSKKVYMVSALRLIVLPALYVTVLKFIVPIFNTDPFVVTLALVAFAAPLGLNTIVFPAAYGGDTKLGAAMTLISSLFCVVTFPLMYYLFVVLWS